MNKKLIILTGLLFFGQFITAQERKKEISIKGGLSISNIVVQRTDPNPGIPKYFGPNKTATSFFAAATVEFPVGKTFSISSGLSFIGKGTNSSIGTENDSRFYVVELPIDLVKNIYFGKNTLYFGAGPYISYLASGMKTDRNRRDFDELSPAKQNLFLRVDAGLNAMTGIKFSEHFKIQADYDYGFMKMLKSPYRNTLVSRAFTLGLGYQF